MGKAFVMYAEYADKLVRLTDEQMGKLMRIIFSYESSGEEPECDDLAVSVAFDFIRCDLDKQNEASQRKAEAGRRGGSKSKQSEAKASKPKQTEAKASTENKENEEDKERTKETEEVKESFLQEKENTKEKEVTARMVIDYLNQKTGKAFRYSESSLKHIRARLNEGFTLGDCMRVIDNKVSEWGRRSEMEKYLRPETLFGGKFEGYLNQVEDVSLPEFMRENRPKMPQEITPLTTAGEIEALMNQLGD